VGNLSKGKGHKGKIITNSNKQSAVSFMPISSSVPNWPSQSVLEVGPDGLPVGVRLCLIPNKEYYVLFITVHSQY